MYSRLSLIRLSLTVFGLWGSPIHWTPNAVITLTIHCDQQLHTAIIQYTSQQSLKSRAIKGKERGVAVSGCRSSVAERWQLKPEALVSIPGTTFLSFPLLFQRTTDSSGTDCLWLDYHYRPSDCGGSSPVHRTPHAVITLTIHCDLQLHTAIIQYTSNTLLKCTVVYIAVSNVYS